MNQPGQRVCPDEKVVTVTPYYSRVRFTTTVTTTPFIYTISANQIVRAFGYQQGGDMAAAGRSGTNATAADTNITTSSQTIGGETLRITGISIQLCSNSQAMSMVAGIWDEISVKISLNGGSNAFLLGTPAMCPGASGLYGVGPDLVGVQAIPGGRPQFGFATNGIPGQLNQAAIPEGFIWKAAGQTDSTLVILLTTERAFASNYSGATASDKVNEAAAAGVRGYTYPAAADVFVEARVRLFGQVTAPRSVNA